jgi:transposase
VNKRGPSRCSNFRLEEQIPENHLLRVLDRFIDFTFVRERLKTFYSSTGRPSIDTEVLLRLLLVGYRMALPASVVC